MANLGVDEAVAAVLVAACTGGGTSVCAYTQSIAQTYSAATVSAAAALRERAAALAIIMPRLSWPRPRHPTAKGSPGRVANAARAGPKPGFAARHRCSRVTAGLLPSVRRAARRARHRARSGRS